MAIKNFTYTVIILACTAVLFTSCEMEDKNCEAGNPQLFGRFPYAPGQTILFRDTLQHEIEVTFNEQYSNSESYTIQGKNALTSRKIEPCVRRSGLEAQVKCTPDTLIRGVKQFSFSFELNEDNQTSNPVFAYSLIAFRSVSMLASIQNGEFIPHRATSISAFTTPSKTYAKVFLSKQQGTQPSKFVYDNQGRLIAFTLQPDTSSFFYLVE